MKDANRKTILAEIKRLRKENEETSARLAKEIERLTAVIAVGANCLCSAVPAGPFFPGYVVLKKKDVEAALGGMLAKEGETGSWGGAIPLPVSAARPRGGGCE